MKTKIARLAVRDDVNNNQCLVLGLTHPEILKPGKVYEIIEAPGLDELVIREVGDSCFNGDPKPGMSWGRDANSIIREGEHLFTKEEHEERERLWAEKIRRRDIAKKRTAKA